MIISIMENIVYHRDWWFLDIYSGYKKYLQRQYFILVYLIIKCMIIYYKIFCKYFL